MVPFEAAAVGTLTEAVVIELNLSVEVTWSSSPALGALKIPGA